MYFSSERHHTLINKDLNGLDNLILLKVVPGMKFGRGFSVQVVGLFPLLVLLDDALPPFDELVARWRFSLIVQITELSERNSWAENAAAWLGNRTLCFGAVEIIEIGKV
jgi:hypothetical protein